MRCQLRCLVVVSTALLCSNSLATWNGRWESKGSDVIIGLSTEPKNPDYAKNSLLIIGYSSKFNCSPVVSSLIINGQKLGAPVSQKTSKSRKNQLIVTVGTKEFTSETKLTEYTNGMELAMRGSQELVDALSNSAAPFSAKIGTLTVINFSGASGFALANQQAKMNCK